MDMDSLDDLLSLNHCDMDDFLDLTHKTMMLFILEDVCRIVKDKRNQIVREYQKSSNNDLVTKRIVKMYCGVELPSNDTSIMTQWIINFLTKMDKRASISKEKKMELLKEQCYLCACCGTRIDLNNSHCDHDIPWTFVGDELDDNYQMLCTYCNEHKSSRPYYMLKRKIIKMNNRGV